MMNENELKNKLSALDGLVPPEREGFIRKCEDEAALRAGSSKRRSGIGAWTATVLPVFSRLAASRRDSKKHKKQ